MPRRGKAATRQARQRRAAMRPVARPASPTTDVARSEPPEASDKNPATPREAVRAPAATATGGGSALSARARDEYHYVVRDLRNIGVLAAVMLGILVAAFVAFRLVAIGA